MTAEKQYGFNDPDGKYYVDRTTALLKQKHARLRAIDTLHVSHTQEASKSLCINRATLNSLRTLAHNGRANLSDMTPNSLHALDYFDVDFNYLQKGVVEVGAESEFYVHLYNSVEAELFDEAAALDEVMA